MNLKTNANMPIHGLDAIHIGVDGDSLVFYYGYSKVFERHGAAIADVVKEIDKFSKSRKRQDREFELISDYIDKEKFREFSEQIVNVISPYAQDKSFVSEAHSIFVGYHWPLLDAPKRPSSVKLDAYIKGEYLKSMPAMKTSIEKHISALPLANQSSFIVWTLPLSNLKKFRAKFIEGLKPT